MNINLYLARNGKSDGRSLPHGRAKGGKIRDRYVKDA